MKSTKANRSYRNARYSRRDIRKNTDERQKLAAYEGLTAEFLATFVCTGQMRYTRDCLSVGRTALFKNVRTADGRQICDHIWIHLDEVRNLDVLSAALGKDIAFHGVTYRYFSESGRHVFGAKYSIGNIFIE